MNLQSDHKIDFDTHTSKNYSALKFKGYTNKRSDGKAILLNLLWSIAAIIINLGINFLVIPYVTENIGIEGYGFVSLANTFTSYVDIITIALNSFVARYITVAYHRGEYEKANMYYSSAIIADVVLSIIVFVPSVFLIIKLENIISISYNLVFDVKLLFLLVFCNYLITTMQTAFNVSTFISNKLDLQTRKKCISFIIRAICLLMLCIFFKPHVWYVALASSFMVIYFFYQNVVFTRILTPELHYKRDCISCQHIKELISSGIWNSINNLGNMLNSGLDLLISNLMLSSIAMGQVSIGKDLAVMCHTLINTISNTFRPAQARLYARCEKDKLVYNLKLSMKITGMFCGIIVSVFLVYGCEFISIWLHRRNDSVLIFELAAIALASDISVGVVHPLYYVYTLTDKLKVPSYITIGMGIANVISMYFLLKYTNAGVYAVVLTTMVINCVNFIDAPLYAAYCLKVRLSTFYPEIIRHLLSVLINVAMLLLLKNVLFVPRKWISLAVICLIGGIICIGISSIIVLNNEEWNRIKKEIKKTANRLIKK